MAFPTVSEIEDLSDAAVPRKLSALLFVLLRHNGEFYHIDSAYVRLILTNLVEALDESDSTDSFGPTGWRDALFE